MKNLKKEINNTNITNEILMLKKEEWLDGLRYLIMKNRINNTREKRLKNNRIYKEDQQRLFTVENERVGDTPNIEEFVEFWGMLWEENKETPNRQWMNEIGKRISSKITVVKDFKICEEDLNSIIRKRKNWSAPGIDGVQNFWWKQFEEARKTAVRIMKKYKEEPESIPEWLPRGRTVMIPKTERRDNVKEQRPITCLNTIYKCLSGMLAAYKMEHAIQNDIWDEQQFGATNGVLGTVDHLLVDQSIMEEVKSKHRNLVVAYYDYQKAYDYVRHDWILRVYRWMGFTEKVIRFTESLMCKWSTRLEVYGDGEKATSRIIKFNRGFLQGDSYSAVGFCLSEVPICIFIADSKGYRMGKDRNVKKTLTLLLLIFAPL